MSEHRDPVDGALDLLRSDEWTGSAYNPELESRLMQEFNRPQSTRRLGRTGWIAASVALVAVSGVSFAAVGGVEKIKNWFVTVEFDGQTRHVELSGDGEATFDIQTEDGATAQVHVKRSEEPGGRMIEASVVRDDGLGQQKEVVQKQIRVMADDARSETSYTLDDLGDAEPIHAWTDADGVDRELYMLPAEEGDGVEFYLATYAEDDSATVRKMAAAPHIDANLEAEPEVSVDDDGTITLKLDNGQGRIAVLRFRTQADGAMPTAPDLDVPGARMIDIQPSGQVKIKLDNDGPNGETEDKDVDVRIEGGR